MKRINRVIFFFGTKFTKRDYKRFGIGKIKKRGYSVEIWDFTPWWKPNYSKKYLMQLWFQVTFLDELMKKLVELSAFG